MEFPLNKLPEVLWHLSFIQQFSGQGSNPRMQLTKVQIQLLLILYQPRNPTRVPKVAYYEAFWEWS